LVAYLTCESIGETVADNCGLYFMQWALLWLPSTRGRCYDHNFVQFWPIFGEKWRFSQKSMLWEHFLQKLTVVWAKNAKNFAKFFGENILEISVTRLGKFSPNRQFFGTFSAVKVMYEFWQTNGLCYNLGDFLVNSSVFSELPGLHDWLCRRHRADADQRLHQLAADRHHLPVLSWAKMTAENRSSVTLGSI
jgi:hypothetical protein